ncbi:unnamed protein product [Rhizophagus irregularis]|nr:unnamed protein product [Rhizophagus irregularis]
MSFHTFQHYTFDTDLPFESSDDPQHMLRNLQSQLQSRQLATLSSAPTLIDLNPLPITSWIPSTKFLKLLDNFNSTILNQFPCASCAFCGHLMYPLKCQWLLYENSYLYPLLQAYPECQSESLLTFHTRSPKRIAKFWNAYLEENPSNYSWLDDTLIEAANWLKQNNPFLKNYSQLLELPNSQTANPFPSAFHLPDDDSAPPYLPNDIVVPNTNFNVEIHNEDYHYTHLMADFILDG